MVDTKDFALTDTAGVTTTFNFTGGQPSSINSNAYTPGTTTNIGYSDLSSRTSVRDAIITKINAGTGIGFTAAASGDNVLVTQNVAGAAGNKTNTDEGTGLTVANFTGGEDKNGILLPSIGSSQMNSTGEAIIALMTGSSISGSADALRHRIQNIQFNNTVELNSSIYFCRINHNEYNYSANPTYLSQSQIRVKEKASDVPVSYITTVGLYSADNQLLAVGKLSEPLRKDPTIEYTLRARLDY